MLSGSFTNEYMPTIQFQSKIIFETRIPDSQPEYQPKYDFKGWWEGISSWSGYKGKVVSHYGKKNPHNVALFCLPPYSTHLLQLLDVGLLELFNTTMELESTCTFMTMMKTLDLHLSAFFQLTSKYARQPTACLLLGLPLAPPVLYLLSHMSLPNLKSKLKKKLNQSYLRRHRTPSASYASKWLLRLPLLR